MKKELGRELKRAVESPSMVTKPPRRALASEQKRRIENYSQVVDKAELNAVRLINSEFSVSPVYFDTDQQTDSEFFYDVTTESRVFDSEAGIGFVFLFCEAGARREDESLVSCVAKYIVSYNGLEGCDDEAAGVFLSKVGRFTCYPYFRTLFATLNASAGTDLPSLPVLKEPIIGRRKKKPKAASDA